MQINLKETIKDYDGTPLIGPKEDKPVTYFEVLEMALNRQVEREVITAERKNQLYQITKKLYSGNEVDFTPSQLEIIKERVGKVYGPLIYGRVLDLIDGEEKTAKEADKPAAPVTPQPKIESIA